MASFSDLVQQRFGLALEVTETVADGDTIAGLLHHRTHRRFLDTPVDEGTLNLLLACALSAPAKSDLQQVAIVRVRDAGKRAAIAELMPAMPFIGTCPVFMVFCGDSRRIRKICELRGRPFANDHLDAFLNAAVDTALVMQNFIIAAQAAGLGCCPISVVRNHIDRIAELLSLPEHVFPVAGMCLGHPAGEGYISMRLPPSLTLHTDSYDDGALAVEIDAYDRRRDAVYSIPPEKQRMTSEYGATDFYGWSEDKARQVSQREREDLAGYLRRHGFNLE